MDSTRYNPSSPTQHLLRIGPVFYRVLGGLWLLEAENANKPEGKRKPLNQYQISDRSGVRRDTVARYLEVAKSVGFVNYDTRPAKRPGCVSKHYKLTERGKYAVFSAIPDLQGDQVKAATPQEREDFNVKQDRIRMRRLAQFQAWAAGVERVLQARRGPPGWATAFEIRTDFSGRFVYEYRKQRGRRFIPS